MSSRLYEAVVAIVTGVWVVTLMASFALPAAFRPDQPTLVMINGTFGVIVGGAMTAASLTKRRRDDDPPAGRRRRP